MFNDELVELWKEMVVLYIAALAWHVPLGNENMRDLNPQEQEADMPAMLGWLLYADGVSPNGDPSQMGMSNEMWGSLRQIA
jgi:hypothetical protein